MYTGEGKGGPDPSKGEMLVLTTIISPFSIQPGDVESVRTTKPKRHKSSNYLVINNIFLPLLEN